MFTVNERTSARYCCTLKDGAGALVPGSVLDSLQLTLINVETNAIINSRDAQDVFDAPATPKNGVTVWNTLQDLGVDADGNTVQGNLLWELSPDDNAIIVPTVVGTRPERGKEIHLAIFDVRWDASARRMLHTIEITVVNIPTISS